MCSGTKYGQASIPSKSSTGQLHAPHGYLHRPKVFDLEKGLAWLQQSVEVWKESKVNRFMSQFWINLKVVNDSAEWLIKDISEYCNTTDDTEDMEDILLLVNDHCDVMQDLRRTALANIWIRTCTADLVRMDLLLFSVHSYYHIPFILIRS